MNVLYLGVGSGTSGHRVAALKRLGHNVTLLDPYVFTANLRLVHSWVRYTGALGLEAFIRERVLAAITGQTFDIALIDAGALIGPSLVRALKKHCDRVVNYHIDDPFVDWHVRTWRLYQKSLPEYDAVFVVREENLTDAKRMGAKQVHWLYRAADEVAHAPLQLTPEEHRQWSSELVFVGTWFPERGPLMARLIGLGVPLSIFGDRWQRSPEWPVIQRAWRGPGLNADNEYRKALMGAKVCLGLVSEGNRDQSTTRTFEITYMGRAFCARRTPEHLRLYREGVEAEFWDTPEECAEKCSLLLSDPVRRDTLARRGRERCIANGTLNERLMASILELSFNPTAAASEFGMVCV